MPWAAIAGAVISAYMANKASKAGQAGAQAGVDAQERMYEQMRTDLAPWAASGQVSLAELMERMGLATPQSRVGKRPTREQFTTQTQGRGGEAASWFNPNPSAGAPAGSNFDQAGYDQAMQDYNQQVAAAGSNPTNFGSLMQPFTEEQFKESPAYEFNLEQGLEAIRKGAARNQGTTYAPQTLRDLGRYAQGTAANEWGTERAAYDADRDRQYGMLSGISEAGRGAASQTGLVGAATGRGVAEFYAGGANARAAGYVGVGNAINEGIGGAYNQYLQQQIINNQQPTYSGRSSRNFGH